MDVFGLGLKIKEEGAATVEASLKRLGAELAKTAGYRKTYEISDLAEWERELPNLLKEDGPIFVDLKVEPGEAYPENFRRLYSIEHREKFRRALQNS